MVVVDVHDDLAEVPALRPGVHGERRRDARGERGGEELVRCRCGAVAADVDRLVGDEVKAVVHEHVRAERAGDRPGDGREAHDASATAPSFSSSSSKKRPIAGAG
jgi:hypothetical protein